MTYAQSLQEAKGHGRAFLKSTIGAHPVATAVVIAILVVLIIVLGFYVSHYKSMCKSGFHIAPISNLTTGNNNPQWQYGNMDAGNWGPIHRDATAWNVAAYHPGWRAGRYRRADCPPQKECRVDCPPPRDCQPECQKECMTSGGPGCAGACGPGETSLVQANCDGSTTSWCRNTDALPGPPTVCGACWDPAATAEAEALATVGSLQHESYGERRLQRAISAAYDSNVGLSDEQLSNLMHQGGTP
jgi:hypothetical protein